MSIISASLVTAPPQEGQAEILHISLIVVRRLGSVSN